MVVAIVALISSNLKRRKVDDEPICYGLGLEVDEHRQKNLALIYNSTDVECLAMLRMTRAHFCTLQLVRQRGFSHGQH